MKKWYNILWGSKEESELEKQVKNSDDSPDPADLTKQDGYGITPY